MILIVKALTSITLTQATGLNPILPILLVAIIARCENIFVSHGWPAPISLPEELMFLTSLWAIVFLIAMTVLESIIDKAQWFDNIKHMTIDPIISSLSSIGITVGVMTEPLREVTGGNTSHILDGLPSCLALAGGGGTAFWAGLIFFIILGLIVTIFFLLIKTALRLVISTLPDMGVSNFLISVLEDAIVVISVILAFFAPVLAIIFTLLLAGSAIAGVLYLKKKADEREKKEIRNLSFVQGIM